MATLEINKLRREKGRLKYRVTATDMGDGQFAATIQIQSTMVVTSAGPYLAGAISLALIEVLEELRELEVP